MGTGRPARIAVVGCGGWSQGYHLPHLHRRSDAVIVALVDPSDKPGYAGCMPANCESLDELSQKYKAKRFRYIEEALADESLHLDGILVATSHTDHASIGKAALAAGKHVLMEKPMTADVEEAKELHTLAKENPGLAFLINNTANWREGTRAACEVVMKGDLGSIRLVNCVFAAPLGWLFEGTTHARWNKCTGTMKGNGFGWGQFSHTFGWVFRVTGLTPLKVYAVCSTSETTGADIYDSVVITCTNGCTINASGVGVIPDNGFKVVGNWVFGTKGMLSYSGLAGSEDDCSDTTKSAANANGDDNPNNNPTKSHLNIWTSDGQHRLGPAFEFENTDQDGLGPGSLDAFVKACRGEDYFAGAGVEVGLKVVCTIDALYRSALTGQCEDVQGCDDLA